MDGWVLRVHACTRVNYRRGEEGKYDLVCWLTGSVKKTIRDERTGLNMCFVRVGRHTPTVPIYVHHNDETTHALVNADTPTRRRSRACSQSCGEECMKSPVASGFLFDQLPASSFTTTASGVGRGGAATAPVVHVRARARRCHALVFLSFGKLVSGKRLWPNCAFTGPLVVLFVAAPVITRRLYHH
jgi:hypothetical protein